MSANYGRKTLQELQQELRRRGVRSTGRKKDLVSRLEALDSMQARGDASTSSSSSVQTSPQIPWPDVGSFRSLVQNSRVLLPEISLPHLEEYIVYRQEKDQEPNSDSRSMQRGHLLQRNKVAGMSFSKKGSHTFFSGLIEAEMKKKVSYSVKFAVGEKGDISTSECDCPAGKGPTATCKHVVAGLLTVIDLKEKGELAVTLACTETLQSFHRPSRTATSPVRAEKLGKGIEERDLFSDPRPQRFRNQPGYQNMVNMLTVNYCNATKRDSNWRYKFGKADLAAAAEDHWYDKLPFTQY